MTVLVIMTMDEKMRWMIINGNEAFEGMLEAGKLAAESLECISAYVKVGITFDGMDRLCHKFIVAKIESSNHAQQPFIDRMIFDCSSADEGSQNGICEV